MGKYSKYLKKSAAKKSTKPTKRPSYGKLKRSKYGQLGTVNLGLGFPKKTSMVHRYRQTFSMTSTTGLIGGFQHFSCNGLFKPDQTNTGHQPMYFDQMAALYDHYVVTAARITLSVMQNTVQNAPSQIGIFENDDTTTVPTQLETIGENPTGTVKLIPATAGANPVLRFVKTYRPKKIWGADPMAVSQQQGTTVANPTEATNWTIVCQAANSATMTYFCVVDIVYRATWTEVRDIAGSS